MNVAKLMADMDRIAPLRFAEPWDNVGLLVGDPHAVVSRVLLCIDLTPAVLAEAVSLRCEAVVAYHPVIFEGVKRLGVGDVAFEAARRGIAVYCPHTALDVAEGGTNDVLCEVMGVRPGVAKALKTTEGKGNLCKLVTYAPPEAMEEVAEAIFAAGAGSIGAYSKCSFRTEGKGTFLGDDSTNPTVGERGKMTYARETKIETILPKSKAGEVVAALRAAHPYEEPAFDLAPLAAIPETLGVGRVADLDETSLGDLVARVKTGLGLHSLLLSGDIEKSIKRVAVCAGAGRGLIDDVLRVKADCYLTGELPHHDVLRLARSGIATICTLHSNSERAVLSRVAAKLEDFICVLSERDEDPLGVV